MSEKAHGEPIDPPQITDRIHTTSPSGLRKDRPVIRRRENDPRYEETRARNAHLVTVRDAARLAGEGEGERAARDQLVLENQKIVTSLVSRVRRSGLEDEDLRQEANTALTRAADAFDASRGTPFGVYASIIEKISSKLASGGSHVVCCSRERTYTKASQ